MKGGDCRSGLQAESTGPYSDSRHSSRTKKVSLKLRAGRVAVPSAASAKQKSVIEVGRQKK